MRIALAQINPTVGDINANLKRIHEYITAAKSAGARVVVFPELAIIGYPPKDLLLKPAFIDDNLAALDHLASTVSGIDVVVGYAARNAQPVGRSLHNAVAVLRDGKIVSTHFKTLLPTYDVFDESRYFEPGPMTETENLVRIHGAIAGLSICEDLWNDEKLIARRLYHQNPIADLNAAGAEFLINASASPFVVGKQAFRVELFGEQVRRFGKPLVYVNQVGGNDELVFDGNSMVFDASGNVIAKAKDFEEDLLVVDVDVPSARVTDVTSARGTGVSPVSFSSDRSMGFQTMPQNSSAESTSPLVEASSAATFPLHGLKNHATEKDKKRDRVELDSIHKALVLGLRDYCRKCSFKSAVLGLSGGIDSALTAAIAVEALGADKVVGVAMPSRFSSDHSIADAKQLAVNLGIAFHLVPIASVHDAYESLLEPHFPGRASDITEENLQARVRGATLMAFSNKYNHLLLTTGNKSEIAVGYCTLYGDMCGGLAIISDVPKTIVWKLSRYVNQYADRELIPQNSIDKIPSAELRPDQTDQDSLPPYDVLDAILFRYVEEEKSSQQIIDDGFEAAVVNRVIQLVDRSEYKRRQSAPGIKVTSRAFGSGRRMPIAQNYVSGRSIDDAKVPVK